MAKRTAIYLRLPDPIGTSGELSIPLRRAVEARGDLVVDTFIDDARIDGKGKNAAWNRLVATLDKIDEIVLHDPGDLPGRTVKDLLAILTKLGGVAIVVPSLGIDTKAGSGAILDLVAVYRAAKLSQSIRRGQQRARASGKRIGRPEVPLAVRRRILADLQNAAGIRATARRHNVSPATVINIKRPNSTRWRRDRGRRRRPSPR